MLKKWISLDYQKLCRIVHHEEKERGRPRHRQPNDLEEDLRKMGIRNWRNLWTAKSGEKGRASGPTKSVAPIEE
ncbi:unnamed protein product [Nezara viridula]|uniref:Uncharacterized protein n=1 Tax=Nezara viridula TaxID=85310 RepID=A0A9P0DZB5_NEZVI|nr:unnamed protein product [Nezara viridula]